MTSITPVAVPTPQATNKGKGPGYVGKITLESGTYEIYASIVAPDGTKTPLSATGGQKTLETICTLSQHLLNAHQAKSRTQGNTPCEAKEVGSSGLITTGNATLSHDFSIQSIASPLATNAAEAMTQLGHPIEASAMKAQDIWNALEKAVYSASGRASSQEELPPAPSRSTAVDLSMQGRNFQDPNWYQNLPPRVKYRMVSELDARLDAGKGSGSEQAYRELWQHFMRQVEETQRLNPELGTPSVLSIIRQEKQQLADACTQLDLVSQIPMPIRQEAKELYATYIAGRSFPLVREKINTLMLKEFNRKEELFQRIRQQAEAQQVSIEAWDRDWAKHHYADNLYSFTQALLCWLDNDG